MRGSFLRILITSIPTQSSPTYVCLRTYTEWTKCTFAVLHITSFISRDTFIHLEISIIMWMDLCKYLHLPFIYNIYIHINGRLFSGTDRSGNGRVTRQRVRRDVKVSITYKSVSYTHRNTHRVRVKETYERCSKYLLNYYYCKDEGVKGLKVKK